MNCFSALDNFYQLRIRDKEGNDSLMFLRSFVKKEGFLL